MRATFREVSTMDKYVKNGISYNQSYTKCQNELIYPSLRFRNQSSVRTVTLDHQKANFWPCDLIFDETSCEPRYEKTCVRGFRPGKTQTGLRSHRS